MSAPQLPDVALYGDWFCPDTIYNLAATARRTSQYSSVPSQYSRETGTPSLESAETSISLKPFSQADEQHEPNRPAVEMNSFVVDDEPTTKQSMAFIHEATPDNSFLGFCKGAWTLQNRDQKGSMKKCSEADAWSRSPARAKSGTAQYLKCREPKCEFRSNFVSSNVFLIWNKVFIYENRGIKLRWPFLAKSHVPQRRVLGSKYLFKCLFCAFLGHDEPSTVYNGMDLYLDHIDKQHRGRSLGDVIEYKTRCISTRVADDKELFDINIWPIAGQKVRETSMYLSDDLLKQPHAERTPASSSPPLTHILRVANVSPLENAPLEIEPKTLPSQDRFNTQVLFSSRGTDSVPGTFRYQSWEDNPAEIWGASDEENHPNRDNISSFKADFPPSNSPPLRSQPMRKLPQPPSPPHDLTASTMQIQTHTSFGQVLNPKEPQISIAGYLDSIVQLFREASAMIDTIRDDQALSQAPIVRLLAESVKETPAEIEKEKNRATLRFGEAFQYGDYTAIWALQQVALQLRDGFLNLLQQAVFDRRPIDVVQLVDAVDSGRHCTVAALHDLKRRLVQSGYGANHQPGPLSHPAHQPPRYPQAYQTTNIDGRHNPEGQYCMSGGGGGRGRVEDESTHSVASATSNDTSLHVHFRK